MSAKTAAVAHFTPVVMQAPVIFHPEGDRIDSLAKVNEIIAQVLLPVFAERAGRHAVVFAGFSNHYTEVLSFMEGATTRAMVGGGPRVEAGF